MLPIPSKKFIPKIFQDDTKSDNLCNKIDDNLEAWKKEILDMKRFIRADEIPSKLLDELGYFVNAGIKPKDTESIKRRKIYSAIATHKKRGEFNNDVKIRIDNITGLSPGARILKADFFGSDDWILCGDGTEPVDRYWSALGCDGIDLELGIKLIGSGSEIECAGNIYIDCHEGILISTLTAAQIQSIVEDLEYDVVPAYMIIYLGYVDATNRFQLYTTIN